MYKIVYDPCGSVLIWHLQQIFHVHILGVHIHVCAWIWSFCDQSRGQEQCSQMTVPTMTTATDTFHTQVLFGLFYILINTTVNVPGMFFLPQFEIR